MNVFGVWDGWLTRQESLALGWTLLHFCWQGAAIAAAYAIADRFTLRARSGVRYAAALAALALMPLAVLATFVVEMHTFRPMQLALHNEAGTHLATIGQPLLLRASGSSVVDAGFSMQGNWLTLHTEQILPWLDALWLLGVLLLAVRALGGWRQLERLRQTALGPIPAELEQSFRRVCDRLQVGRRVMLRISDKVISPMAMGVWRATVILPMSAVMRLSPEELEAVLAHELGHIRRWDYACNLLQTALETVLFFHPAMWWLSRTVRYRREVCCDEIAIDNCVNAIVYAQTLLRLEEQKIKESQLAMALRGSGGSLLRRVMNVLGEDGQMESKMTSSVRVAVAGAILIGLFFGPKLNDAVAAVSLPAVEHISALSSATSTADKTNQDKSIQPISAKQVLETSKANEDQPDSAEAETVSSGAVAQQETSNPTTPQAETKPSSKGSSYIDGMRDAGYPLDLNNDLNTLISMKSLGVTPEYAKQMASVGFGKPTVHELMSLKALGVTPEYVAEMKQSNIEPKDFHEVESEKAIGLTPEYAKQMATVGLGNPTVHELMSLKALGVTPEYLTEMRQSGLGPKDFHEAETEKALGITPEYAAGMKKSGFGDLNVHELVSLKAQNVTPEYVTWLKQQFPQITLDEMRRAAVFHLDEKFLADAKSHGFDGKDLDKLLRLKMSGLLDE